jgi:ribosomal protein S18 acetylase RimI-like enzyme
MAISPYLSKTAEYSGFIHLSPRDTCPAAIRNKASERALLRRETLFPIEGSIKIRFLLLEVQDIVRTKEDYTIDQIPWDKVDVSEIAKLMHYVRSEEGFQEFSVDRLSNYIRRIRERFPAEVTFLARRADNLVGWISIHRSSETLGEVDRWHPLVNPDEDESLGKELVERCNEYCRSHGITRLICTLSDLTENLEEVYQKRKKWFDSAGWSLLAEDAYLVREVKEEVVPESTLEDEYSLESLKEKNQNDLYQCYEDAFLAGDDREIHAMTPDQRRERFGEHYSRESVIEESSVVVMKGQEIAGFVIVNNRENEHYVDLIGVHPNHRRKGLAKALLERVIKIAAVRNVEVVTIGVDLVNNSAFQFYKKMGFAIESRGITYSWSA